MLGSHLRCLSSSPVITSIVSAFLLFTFGEAISQELCSLSTGNSDERSVLSDAFVPSSAETHTIEGDSVRVAWTQYFDEEFHQPYDNMSAMTIGQDGYIYLTGYNPWNGYNTVRFDSTGEFVWSANFEPYDSFNEPVDIVVDESLNIFVVGSHGSNFIILKYNTDGFLLWQRVYDSGYGYDYPKACVLDGSGGIVVTGTIRVPSGGNYYWENIATIRIDANGEVVWATQYEESAYVSDWPEDVGIDPWGNIYVTGVSQGQLLLIKYSSQGIEQWVECYSSPGEYPQDHGYALAIDELGNVYVTGSGSHDYATDYITMKFDENGSRQWVSRFDANVWASNMPVGIDVDSEGAVIVGGTFRFDYSSSQNILLVKYAPDGTELWNAQYDQGSNTNKYACDLGVDSEGSVYVTGFTDPYDAYEDIVTVKYSSGGVLEWESLYDGPHSGEDKAFSLAIGNSGKAYVAGTTDGVDTGSDYVLLCLNASGEQQWTAFYNDPNGKSVNRAHDMVVLPSGQSIIAGSVLTNGITASDYDIALVRYSDFGDLQWQALWDDGNEKTNHFGDMAVGPNGSICICGNTYYDELRDQFTILYYDQAGELIWSEQFGDSLFTEKATALDIDIDGNVIIAGKKSAYSYDPAYLTVSYDSQGTLRWFNLWDCGGLSCDDPLEVVTDVEGNSYVCGYVGYDYGILKYSPLGNLEWMIRHDGFAHWFDYPTDCALGQDGNVYVTGRSRTSGDRYVYLTVSYTPDGDERWESVFAGYSGAGGQAYALGLDDSGAVYVTGTCEDSNGIHDLGTVKYDGDGNELWSTFFDAPNDFNVHPGYMTVDPLGGVCITGYLYEEGSDRDFITVKYDEFGTERWWARFNSQWEDYDYPVGIGADAEGDIYVAGTSYGPDYTYTFTTIKYEQFLVSGDRNPSLLPKRLDITGIHPNPMGRKGMIDYAVPRVMTLSVNLYDITGRQVRSWLRNSLPAGYHSMTWDLRDDEGNPVPNGTYFLRITGEGAGKNRKIVVLR